MSNINPSRTKQRVKVFPLSKHKKLDRFVLCRWNLIYGCMVDTSHYDLAQLLREIPEYLYDGNDETLCVCEVISWRGDADMNDIEPHEVETLYQIEHYVDPSEEDDEVTEQTTAQSASPRA